MIKSKYVEAHIRLWSSSNLRQNMKRVGNIASNRVYNPQNANPPIPLDVDEADSAMEMFIRQKYIDRAVKAPVRDNTGSTNSDDQPTPLLLKTGSRFGFRSASSIFHFLRSIAERQHNPIWSPQDSDHHLPDKTSNPGYSVHQGVLNGQRIWS